MINWTKSYRCGALARVCSMSPAHFARMFKESTGASPHSYVIGPGSVRRVRGEPQLGRMGGESMKTLGRAVLSAAVLIAVLNSCGGGGGGSGAAGVLATLEVTPASATIVVSDVAQYSVVARDGTGLVMAAPPVVWVSDTPAVGTITSAGLATGVSLGQTPITATAGSVASPPAVLNVVETTACDGIAAVQAWTVNLEYLYGDDITTNAGAFQADTNQHVTVAATLAVTGPVFGNELNWTGPLVLGPAHPGSVLRSQVAISENLNDQVSDPTTVAELSDNRGSPVPTPGVDGFRLEVDLSACTFRFFAAPSANTTLTITEHAVNTVPGPNDGIPQVSTQDTPLGLLQKGVTPLGSWRANGLGDFSQIITGFASYSVAATVPVGVDAYIPSGVYAQPAFFDPFNPVPRLNTADMYYKILPQL